MSSQVPSSSTPNPTSPARAKASNRSLVILAVLLAGAGIAAFAIPEVLKQIYLAEEEAKRKQGPIVGNLSNATPPPGVSTNPYAGMSGGNAGGGEKPAEEKPAEEKPAEEKTADDKPAGDEASKSESEDK